MCNNRFIKCAALDCKGPLARPSVFDREVCPEWSRLRIDAHGQEIPLMLSLCERCGGSFGVLYVLVIPIVGIEGRYQIPAPIVYDELAVFLTIYRAFLEQDGRHHIWIASIDHGWKCVYDRHNIIYAYGDLDDIERRLRERGFSAGTVEIPMPHEHRYHAEFDDTAEALLSHYNWKHFPLQPIDTR